MSSVASPSSRLRRRTVGPLAAAVGRDLAARRARLAGALIVIVQTGLCAGLAWSAAQHLLGHERPFFACIAAMAALGGSSHYRARRALEMVGGVGIGIICGELIEAAIGRGALQISIVVACAMAAATLFGEGGTLVAQAGLSGLFVLTIDPLHVVSPARLLDVALGGALALVASAVVFARSPERIVEEIAVPLLDDLTSALDETAAGLAVCDVGHCERALERARALDERASALHAAARAAVDEARFAPTQRPHDAEALAEEASHLETAVRSSRSMIRLAVRLLHTGVDVPDGLSQVVVELAQGARALSRQRAAGGDAAITERLVLGAAERAGQIGDHADLTVSAICSQALSVATDLLRAGGMSPDESRRLVDDLIGAR
jgi:uncharacterized membrane protein YgaE (UPF0421/DUF939 family)